MFFFQFITQNSSYRSKFSRPIGFRFLLSSIPSEEIDRSHFKNKNSNQRNDKCKHNRGGSRAAATSKME